MGRRRAGSPTTEAGYRLAAKRVGRFRGTARDGLASVGETAEVTHPRRQFSRTAGVQVLTNKQTPPGIFFQQFEGAG